MLPTDGLGIVSAVARVVIVGAGAVGLFYGARLAAAGHDVVFVARRELEALRQRGLELRSPEGDLRLSTVAAVGYGEPVVPPADLLLCTLKTTALDVAAELCAPAVGPGTRVVALMNGLDVEAPLAERFGAARVFGVMAFVGVHREEPGVVRHVAYGRVTVGHLLDDRTEAEHVAELFRSAGIEAVVAPSLRYARWEKLCWNVPFNGLSVAADGADTATILADEELRRLAERAMREGVATANADLAARGAEERFVADDVVSRLFAQTVALGPYRTSMLIDYEHGRPLEVEAILGNPVRRARELHLEVPTMEALYALVRARDRRLARDREAR